MRCGGQREESEHRFDAPEWWVALRVEYTNDNEAGVQVIKTILARMSISLVQ